LGTTVVGSRYFSGVGSGRMAGASAFAAGAGGGVCCCV